MHDSLEEFPMGLLTHTINTTPLKAIMTRLGGHIHLNRKLFDSYFDRLLKMCIFIKRK